AEDEATGGADRRVADRRRGCGGRARGTVVAERDRDRLAPFFGVGVGRLDSDVHAGEADDACAASAVAQVDAGRIVADNLGSTGVGQSGDSLLPYTTLFRSAEDEATGGADRRVADRRRGGGGRARGTVVAERDRDRLAPFFGVG